MCVRACAGPQRFNYYRTNSTGHNVLRFDGANQNELAVSPITVVNTTGGFGVVNLSDAYQRTVQRGFALTKDSRGDGLSCEWRGLTGTR